MSIYKEGFDVLKQITTELEQFKTEYIRVADGFECNQRKIIHDNIRAYNSKFEGGDLDSEGFTKFYKNIVKAPCNNASKAIGFEPKHIILRKRPGQNDRVVWFMDRDFKFWMKDNAFSTILRKIFKNLPMMGSAVIKLVQGVPYEVDLRNLALEQSADTMRDADYVIEQHYYTPRKLRKQNWDKKKIDKAIEEFRKSKEKYLRVLERYGDVQLADGSWEYHRVIAYVPERGIYQGQPAIGTDIVSPNGTVLDQRAISEDEFPYREFHYDKIAGRWLGIGIPEVLRDPQIRTNEITNLRIKSSYFAGLHVFQTMDDNFKKNILKDMINGDVIRAAARIERIPTEERNLTAFDMEERGWLASRDENTFSHDVVRGERLPAGTPLGSAQLAATMVMSYFQTIQKDVAEQIKQFITKDVIPSFKKQAQHYICLIGEDLEEYTKLEIDHKHFLEVIKFALTKNKIPTQAQADAMKQVIADKHKANDIFVPADYYKNVEYIIDIEITGQYRDSRVDAANNTMILQAMAADPTILTDPVKRKIFAEMLEGMGKNITDFGTPPIAPVEQNVQGQVGGGISRPNIPQNIAMEPEL